jgi:hypothetical protein
MPSSLSAALDAALLQAVDRESYELDPVATRLRATHGKRKRVQLVCVVKCGNRRCGHLKVDPLLT